MPKFNQRKNMNTKLVYCVRTDLKMGKGKIAAQCCHATLGILEENIKRKNPVWSKWKDLGQAKIVVKIKSEREMFQLQRKANEMKIPSHIVCDAGHTQVESGSNTVLVIGPDYDNRLNMVTGHLKLM